jgi:hypothetical protein
MNHNSNSRPERHYFSRNDYDDFMHHLHEYQIKRAEARGAVPFLMIFSILAGLGLRYIFGNIFFDGWYFVYGGLGFAFLIWLIVGIDFGHRVH